MIQMNAIHFSVDKNELTEGDPVSVNEMVEKIMAVLRTNPDLSFRNNMYISVNETWETHKMVVSMSFH